VLGASHPNTLITMANLASALRDLGHDDEALATSEQALELARKRLPANHSVPSR
jgi:hypothetical protein